MTICDTEDDVNRLCPPGRHEMQHWNPAARADPAAVAFRKATSFSGGGKKNTPKKQLVTLLCDMLGSGTLNRPTIAFKVFFKGRQYRNTKVTKHKFPT